MSSSEVSRKYANPPILEAIIGVEFAVLNDDPLRAVTALASAFTDEYPQQGPTLMGTAELAFGQQVGSVSRQEQIGVTSVAPDRRSALDLTVNGLTFKRLAPYTSWAEFSVHARRVWEQLIRSIEVQPRMTGVRYINRIDIPLGVPMERFIRTYPEVSRDLPQLLNQYTMRLDIPLDADGVAIIQQAFIQAGNIDEYAVLLDIDVRLPVTEVSKVWESINIGRDEKNRIFEACITDELRERFA